MDIDDLMLGVRTYRDAVVIARMANRGVVWFGALKHSHREYSECVKLRNEMMRKAAELYCQQS